MIRSYFPIDLGEVLVTHGAALSLINARETPMPYLIRHAAGDWGIVSEQDAAANMEAVKHGERLLSAYQLATGVVIWIITEADRSSTTILLPTEY